MKITRFLAFGLMLTGLVLNGCLNTDDPAADLPSIATLIADNGELTQLERALEITNLTSVLDETGGATIFAPNDFAFAEFVARQGFNSMDEIPVDVLRNVLLYHVFSGKADIVTIGTGYYQTNNTEGPNGTAVVTLIIRRNDQTRLNEEATVVVEDIEGRNGYVHIVNDVLTPPNLSEIFAVNEAFSVFVEGINRIGRPDLLLSDRPITVFAPPDEAFEEFFDNSDTYSNIGEIPLDRLEDLILHHFIGEFKSGDDLSEDVVGGTALYTTFAGDSLFIAGQSRNLTVDNRAIFISVNINGTNGVTHFVDKVLDINF
ncbi:MAG: fasciclin domain-containing protein [Bacteroidota bacterium]